MCEGERERKKEAVVVENGIEKSCKKKGYSIGVCLAKGDPLLSSVCVFYAVC